jgi:transcriptional regulator with XRE-family HTH domain
LRQINKEVRKDPKLARLVKQEELILGVTELILGIMEKKGINKSQLAKLLGLSEGYLTSLFRGSRNMSLRTLSDIFFVLDFKVVFSFKGKK